MKAVRRSRDYHEWITNLQYFPSKEESLFLMAAHPHRDRRGTRARIRSEQHQPQGLAALPTNQLRSGTASSTRAASPQGREALEEPREMGKDSIWATGDSSRKFLALPEEDESGGQESRGERENPRPTTPTSRILSPAAPSSVIPCVPGDFACAMDEAGPPAIRAKPSIRVRCTCSIIISRARRNSKSNARGRQRHSCPAIQSSRPSSA